MGLEVDGILDIECANWTQFVVGGLLTGRGYQAFTWERELDLVDLVLSLKGNVWAHFGGGYDLKWLLDHCAERGLAVSASTSGSRIVSARVGKVMFRDSWALTTLSLEKLTAGLQVSKSKLPWPCLCLEGCGGYCRISRDMTPARMRILKQYLEADCRSLWLALVELDSWATAEGVRLKGTVGSTAWATADAWLDFGENEFKLDTRAGMHRFNFTRSAYYGGRVHVGRRFSRRGREVDIISSYPTQLKTRKFPVGKCRVLEDRAAQLALELRQPGCYSGIVRVPDKFHIAPVPLRTRQRIAYPIGSFSGSWALPELAHAQEQGCTVQVDKAIVWESEDSIFAPYVERIFAARQRAGRKSPMGEYAKVLLNSLAGKLGSDVEHWHLEAHPKKVRVCPCTGACQDGLYCPCGGWCMDDCDGSCGAHVPLGDATVTPWQKRQTVRIDDCSRPQHAAYITSGARIAWWKQATAVEDGRDVVYGDTDSIFSEQPRTMNVGDGLGAWEDGGEYFDLIVVAPKIYTCKRKGGVKTRAKGLAKASLLGVDKLVPPIGGKTGPIPASTSLRGIWAGAREGKLFERANVERHISWGTGDRQLNADGITTRPSRVQELER